MKNKIINQSVSMTLAAALLFGMAVCNSFIPGQAVQGVKAARKAKVATSANINMVTGQKTTIKIKFKKKNAKYSFISSSKKVAMVNAKGVVKAVRKGKAVIKVMEKPKGKKKAAKIGAVKVTVREKSVTEKVNVTETPAGTVQTPIKSPAPTQPAGINTATPSPSPVGTPDVYSEELFSIEITEKNSETVDGTTCKVEMQLFEGIAKGDAFEGSTKAGACNSNVTKTFKDGTVTNQARFILEGTDSDGEKCRIYIQDDGIMSDNVLYTRPIIFTDSKELEWLEKADIQGRVITDSNGRKIVKYMRNPSSENEFTIPPVVRPDTSKDYNREIFTFYIGIGSSDEVKGSTGTSTMIHFTCKGECENFNGEGIKGFDFVDTRHKIPGRVETLSARYILEGTDKDGNPCKIYVENNGIDDNGMVTEPTIITDCPDYGWVETAPLHGTVSWEKGLTIHMWTAE